MLRILADIADPFPVEPVSHGVNLLPLILLIAVLVIIVGVAAFFIIKKIKKGK